MSVHFKKADECTTSTYFVLLTLSQNKYTLCYWRGTLEPVQVLNCAKTELLGVKVLYIRLNRIWDTVLSNDEWT